jgi:hypothetical protein
MSHVGGLHGLLQEVLQLGEELEINEINASP